VRGKDIKNKYNQQHKQIKLEKMSSTQNVVLKNEGSYEMRKEDETLKSDKIIRMYKQIHLDYLDNENKFEITPENIDDINDTINTFSTFVNNYQMYERGIHNYFIHSHTQTGKTNFLIKIVKIILKETFETYVLEMDIKKKILFVISASDITSILNQTIERFRSALDEIKNESDYTILNIRESKPKEYRGFVENMRIGECSIYILFMLDNYSNVSNLYNYILNFYALDDEPEEKQIFLIHDEADMVIKEPLSNDIKSVAYKNWNNLLDFLKKKRISTKRLFLSATPDAYMYHCNCLNNNMIFLKPQSNYSGYEEIEYLNRGDMINKIKETHEPKKVMYEYFRRITQLKKTDNNIILYINEVKTSEQISKAIILSKVAPEYFVINYTGKEITLILPDRIREPFENYLSKNKQGYFSGKDKLTLKYEFDIHNYTVGENIKVRRNILIFKNNKNLQLQRILTLIYEYNKGQKEAKNVNHNIIINGQDMINRGLSIIDEYGFYYPTVMILRKSDSSHAVNIQQTIGRITGNIGEGIKRYLITEDDTYKKFRNYNESSKLFFKELSNIEGNKDISEIYRKYKFDSEFKLKNIDNPMKQIKRHHVRFVKTDTDNNINIMEHIITKWWKKNTLRGKILEYIYKSENHSVTKEQLSKFLEENKCINIQAQLAMFGIKSKEEYVVYEKENEKYSLRNESILFLNNLIH